jgi:hypothetical protein
MTIKLVEVLISFQLLTYSLRRSKNTYAEVAGEAGAAGAAGREK